MKKLFLFLALCLFAVSAVVADDESESTANAKDNLQVRADRIGCTIDFHISVVNNVISSVPLASNLSSYVNMLEEDKEKLNEIANSGNATAFHEFIKATLRNDTKVADQAVREVKKNTRQYNISQQTRKSLRQNFNSTRKEFSECTNNANDRLLHKKIDIYIRTLDRADRRISNLSARGIDTEGMEQIVAEARTTILEPLQAAVGNNESAVRKYCLFSGCKDGVNFHFAVRFEQARLKALLAYLNENANATESQTESVQNHVGLSEQELGKGNKDSAWNHVKMAQDAFKQELKELKAARKGEAQ